MTHDPPDKVYACLEQIDRADPVSGAICREQAVAVLADTEVSLDWRKAISQRLDWANSLLVQKNVDGDDSY